MLGINFFLKFAFLHYTVFFPYINHCNISKYQEIHHIMWKLKWPYCSFITEHLCQSLELAFYLIKISRFLLDIKPQLILQIWWLINVQVGFWGGSQVLDSLPSASDIEIYGSISIINFNFDKYHLIFEHCAHT